MIACDVDTGEIVVKNPSSFWEKLEYIQSGDVIQFYDGEGNRTRTFKVVRKRWSVDPSLEKPDVMELQEIGCLQLKLCHQ